MAIYNVSKIENWHDVLVSCEEKFSNGTYSEYKNSYVKSCKDPAMSRINLKISQRYSKMDWTAENLSLSAVGATICTAGVSVIEGVVKLGESIVDLASIIGTVSATSYTFMMDLTNKVAYKMTGDEKYNVNYNSGKGMVGTIRVNSADDIPPDICDKIQRPTYVDNSIRVVTSDGSIYNWGDPIKKVFNPNLEKLIENSKVEENAIKKEILNNIDPKYSEIQTLRKAYIELNKRLNYDVDFALGSDKIKHDILDKVADFSTLSSKNVVCKGWSELYSELLISSGIDPGRIKIVKPDNIKHWWVEVDMGNSIIRADATDVFLGSTDLANCKFNGETNGFLYLNKDNAGIRINDDILEKNPDILNNSNAYFKNIDNSISYTSNGNYFAENVKNLDELFNGAEDSYANVMNEALLYKNKLKIFTEMDIPTGMNGYDAFAYYRKFSNTLFGNDKTVRVETGLRKIEVDGKFYSAVELVIHGEDNVTFIVFDEINGKQVFSKDEYMDGPINQYDNFERETHDKIRNFK